MGQTGGCFLKIFTKDLLGIGQANCFRTHNELTMGLLGKYPLAPSEGGLGDSTSDNDNSTDDGNNNDDNNDDNAGPIESEPLMNEVQLAQERGKCYSSCIFLTYLQTIQPALNQQYPPTFTAIGIQIG